MPDIAAFRDEFMVKITVFDVIITSGRVRFSEKCIENRLVYVTKPIVLCHKYYIIIKSSLSTKHVGY